MSEAKIKVLKGNNRKNGSHTKQMESYSTLRYTSTTHIFKCVEKQEKQTKEC